MTRSEISFRIRFAHPMSSNSFGINPRQTVDDFSMVFAHLRLEEKFQSDLRIFGWVIRSAPSRVASLKG